MNVVQVYEGDGVNPKWADYKHGNGCGAGVNAWGPASKAAFLGDGYGGGKKTVSKPGDGKGYEDEILPIPSGTDGDDSGDGVGFRPETDADPGAQQTW